MRWKFVNALLALLLWPGSSGAADEAWLAWLRDGQVEVRSLSGGSTATPLTRHSQVPLGSLWKLFVHAWLVDSQSHEPAYVCASRHLPRPEEEQYCCEPGEEVGRDQALARSCAAYFAPARLGVQPAAWRAHVLVPWLADMNALRPETQVSLTELLQALAGMSPPARAAARKALLDVGVVGYGREAWTQLGSGIRYKTFSWHKPDGSALGGAAGWLADGTPFWFGARGSSRSALRHWAGQLAAHLPELRWPIPVTDADASACVDVDFFTRYPLKAVWQAHAPVQAAAGVLRGRYRLEFVNGNWLTINAAGQLTLQADERPTLSGRFTLNDYVARVVEREGDARVTQAARALAIAARTYLLQNGRFQEGCWRISDSSQTQRVSPNLPSQAALAAAWFSDEIVLSGAPIQYHRDQAGPNRMAWQQAVAQAQAGQSFEHILQQAYPQAVFSTLAGQTECRRLLAAEQWLQTMQSRWMRTLQREAGFEALPAVPQVCALNEGHPYSDPRRLRIYACGWRSLEERITLAHEYLHLVFRFHPKGLDEVFVEQMARRLVEG